MSRACLLHFQLPVTLWFPLACSNLLSNQVHIRLSSVHQTPCDISMFRAGMCVGCGTMDTCGTVATWQVNVQWCSVCYDVIITYVSLDAGHHHHQCSAYLPTDRQLIIDEHKLASFNCTSLPLVKNKNFHMSTSGKFAMNSITMRALFSVQCTVKSAVV